jgi:hypothetical protein
MVEGLQDRAALFSRYQRQTEQSQCSIDNMQNMTGASVIVVMKA